MDIVHKEWMFFYQEYVKSHTIQIKTVEDHEANCAECHNPDQTQLAQNVRDIFSARRENEMRQFYLALVNQAITFKGVLYVKDPKAKSSDGYFLCADCLSSFLDFDGLEYSSDNVGLHESNCDGRKAGKFRLIRVIAPAEKISEGLSKALADHA